MESQIEPPYSNVKEIIAKQAGFFTAKLLPEKVNQEFIDLHLEMSLRITLKKADFTEEHIEHLSGWIKTAEASEVTLGFSEIYREEIS